MKDEEVLMSLTYFESLCFRNGPYHQCPFKLKKLSPGRLRFLSRGKDAQEPESYQQDSKSN